MAIPRARCLLRLAKSGIVWAEHQWLAERIPPPSFSIEVNLGLQRLISHDSASVESERPGKSLPNCSLELDLDPLVGIK
jgi:hypothetical protein